jgi:hypothetical protein
MYGEWRHDKSQMGKVRDHLGHLNAVSDQDVINLTTLFPTGRGEGTLHSTNMKTFVCCSCITRSVLSLFVSCKLLFPLVGLKISSLLERSPLSLVSTIEELLERNSSGSGLESQEYGRRGYAALPTRHPSIRKSWH